VPRLAEAALWDEKNFKSRVTLLTPHSFLFNTCHDVTISERALRSGGLLSTIIFLRHDERPNTTHVGPGRLAVLLACAALLQPLVLPAAPLAVRHREGLVHGFLVLRTLDGDSLADGDLIQVAHGDRVTSRLVFRFKDGSLHDETAVFSQHRNFQLLSDHLVQKGPAFEHPLEASINVTTGQVTVRNTDGNGKEKVVTDRLDLPPDLANGLVLTLLKNIRSDAPQTKVSMVVFTPKPHLVRLAITPQGEEAFSIGGSSRKATHYVAKVEIGGAAGLVATLLGKQPPDSHVWILGGEAPAFVKSEGPLYLGGPIWRIELASPVWTAMQPAHSKN
jgi:hypothetical protein